MKVDWMTTYTGIKLNPLNLHPDDIVIEDIAHHLSLLCRYNGACKFLYTVGQHCVFGVDYVSQGNELAYLLHDASEAYLSDMVKGVKDQLEVFRIIEDRLQGIIYKKFNVEPFDHAEVKRVDYAIMNTEAHAIMSNLDGWLFPEPPLDIEIKYWVPMHTEEKFLQLYEKYKRKLS